MKIFTQAIVAAGLMIAGTATAVAQSDPFPDQNNYQCYQVEKVDPASVNEKVKVEDQFGGYGQFVANLVTVCNPVSINGEPIANKEAHLTCYRTDPNNDGDLEPQTVAVYNRFGEAKVALRRVATLLCVTAKKEHLR